MTEPTTRPAADTQDDVSDLVDRYLSGWNETHRQERLPIIEDVWEADCALVDPPLDGVGRAGVDAMVEALHAHYPDHRVQRVGPLDQHHDAFRASWQLRGPNGEVALAATDYGIVGPTGRLSRVIGFFDVAGGR